MDKRRREGGWKKQGRRREEGEKDVGKKMDRRKRLRSKEGGREGRRTEGG